MNLRSPYDVCALVLAVVQEALDTAKRPVAVTQVAVGALTIDDCCNGSLIVAPERVFRVSQTFPAEASEDARCDPHMVAVTVLVRVDRCVPVITDTGKAPPVEDQEAAAKGLLVDAAVVWGAVTSVAVVEHGHDEWERANVEQQFIGGEGGCVAVETRVTLGLPASAWCV